MWVRFTAPWTWPKGLPWHVDHQPAERPVCVKRACGEAAVAAGVAVEHPAPARDEHGLADPEGG